MSNQSVDVCRKGETETKERKGGDKDGVFVSDVMGVGSERVRLGQTKAPVICSRGDGQM